MAGPDQLGQHGLGVHRGALAAEDRDAGVGADVRDPHRLSSRSSLCRSAPCPSSPCRWGAARSEAVGHQAGLPADVELGLDQVPSGLGQPDPRGRRRPAARARAAASARRVPFSATSRPVRPSCSTTSGMPVTGVATHGCAECHRLEQHRRQAVAVAVGAHHARSGEARPPDDHRETTRSCGSAAEHAHPVAEPEPIAPRARNAVSCAPGADQRHADVAAAASSSAAGVAPGRRTPSSPPAARPRRSRRDGPRTRATGRRRGRSRCRRAYGRASAPYAAAQEGQVEVADRDHVAARRESFRRRSSASTSAWKMSFAWAVKL